MARRKSKAVLYQSTNFRAEVTGSISEQLSALAGKVKSDVIRSAARAGALVYYDEMRLRVPTGETGELYNSIYHYHDDDQSSETRHVYIIGPNKKKAPHWYNVEYGHWRYNRSVGGRWLRSRPADLPSRVRGPQAHTEPGALAVPQWVPARPYVRPTAIAKRAAAEAAVLKRFAENFREIATG